MYLIDWVGMASFRRCVSRHARPQVIEEAHGGDSGGHFVAEIAVKKILQVGLWWEQITPDVMDYCKKCDMLSEER